MTRRTLRLDDGEITVAREARFDSEAQLHSAIAAHPEVLPAEDVGMAVITASWPPWASMHTPLSRRPT
jgi:hypothetical protein